MGVGAVKTTSEMTGAEQAVFIREGCIEPNPEAEWLEYGPLST